MDQAADSWILVVEHEPAIRELYAAILVPEGYRVHSASNGQEALDALRGGLRPRLILTNLHMPVLDGRALRAALRQDPALASIPVIVASGGGQDPRGQAPFDPRDGFLRKPFGSSQLLALVRSMTTP